MALYFTSDLHLGHKNAIKLCNRPFSTVEEMNCALIDNINDSVKKEDELWILGDFSYRANRQEACEWRSKIICKKVHLIYGNHDKNFDNLDVFSSTQHYRELKTDLGKVVLFHYPIADWNGKFRGSLHLHGHVHETSAYNQKNVEQAQFLMKRTCAEKPPSLIWDVGVDANDYKPISLNEIWEAYGIGTTY